MTCKKSKSLISQHQLLFCLDLTDGTKGMEKYVKSILSIFIRNVFSLCCSFGPAGVWHLFSVPVFLYLSGLSSHCHLLKHVIHEKSNYPDCPGEQADGRVLLADHSYSMCIFFGRGLEGCPFFSFRNKTPESRGILGCSPNQPACVL